MRFKLNSAINASTWTQVISGLPTIAWSQPLILVNTTNQERGEVKCMYMDDGTIKLITIANKNYLNAGDAIYINGIVMI